MSITDEYEDFNKRELLEYIAIMVEQQPRRNQELNLRLSAIEKTLEWIADSIVQIEKKMDMTKHYTSTPPHYVSWTGNSLKNVKTF